MSRPFRYLNWEYGPALEDLPERLEALGFGLVGAPTASFWASSERHWWGLGPRVRVLHSSPECPSAADAPVALDAFEAVHNYEHCHRCGTEMFSFWGFFLEPILMVLKGGVSLAELLAAPSPDLAFRGKVFRAAARLEDLLATATTTPEAEVPLREFSAPLLDAAAQLLGVPVELSDASLERFLSEVNHGQHQARSLEDLAGESYLWFDLRGEIFSLLATNDSSGNRWVADALLGFAASKVASGSTGILLVPSVVAWAAVRCGVTDVRVLHGLEPGASAEVLEVLDALLCDAPRRDSAVNVSAYVSAAQDLDRLDRI